MAKTLKELFQTADITTLNVQDGIPVAPDGKTMEERYDIKNSKDINLSSASPLMGALFFGLNKARKAGGDAKTETFLEEELIGLRTLRGLSSPIIYGSDIIRLKLGSTPMVEKMRESAKGNDSNSLTKFGQQIQQTRNEVNNFLGIPKPLNPTEYYKDFIGPAIYDREQTLLSIRDKAKGSSLGKLLTKSKGNLQTVGTQTLGNAVSIAKDSLKKAVLGNTDTSTISNKYNPNYTNLIRPIQKYSQLDSGNDSYSKKYKEENTDIKGLFDSANKSKGFPFKFGYEYSAKGIPPTHPSGEAQNYPYDNSIPYKYTIQEDSVYTKRKNTHSLTQAAKGDGKVTVPITKDVTPDQAPKKDKVIDINNLRPTNLKDVKKPTDAPSYSKSKGMRPIGKSSIYGNLAETLETKRGLGSNRDALNQTGKFSKGDLGSIKYGGDGIEKMDLIPLRFQKVNDLSAVYFRAVINGFSETFTPSWESSKFLGNPFNFYSFTDIERKVGFTLKVYAMSQVELIMMWRRLEYLAKLTYPHDYIAGYGVEPSLMYFTLGSMYVDKPAIITSLTYTIDDNEQLWELGGDSAKIGKDRYESGFDGKFNSGEKNQTSIGKGGGIQNYKSAFTKYSISQNGETVTEDTIKTNVGKPTDTTDFIIETEKLNADMDQYKLPKFISAQIEITFLESKNNTVDNLYGYGKTITGGK